MMWIVAALMVGALIGFIAAALLTANPEPGEREESYDDGGRGRAPLRRIK